jgi:hypothetical protein
LNFVAGGLVACRTDLIVSMKFLNMSMNILNINIPFDVWLFLNLFCVYGDLALVQLLSLCLLKY